MWRIALVAIAAIMVSVLAVRNAAVLAFAQDRPVLAGKAWPSHPRVATQLTLAEIGRTTAKGRTPDAATLARVRAVLEREPLAAEPFLVEGTGALSGGQLQRAEALLAEAARRDPRLPAARYLLADLYLRQGRTAEGLREVAALIRRLPKAAGPLTPSLAAYARQPGAANQVRAILRSSPELRGNVLAILADDPSNVALVLGLAGQEPEVALVPDWQARLLHGLVQAGKYEQAYQLWKRFSGIAQPFEAGFYNPGFKPSRALPPFNWTLAAGAAGVAEPAPGGGLHVLFYGREEAMLAGQLLLLKPGRYRLRYELDGSPKQVSPLFWAINCLPGNSSLALAPVGLRRELAFIVPASCLAQDLQLRGSVAEMPTNVDLTIRRLELTREGAR